MRRLFRARIRVCRLWPCGQYIRQVDADSRKGLCALAARRVADAEAHLAAMAARRAQRRERRLLAIVRDQVGAS